MVFLDFSLGKITMEKYCDFIIVYFLFFRIFVNDYPGAFFKGKV